jgi:hypothetical protein
MNQETSCQVLVAQISDASKERVVIVGANGSRNSWAGRVRRHNDSPDVSLQS